MLVQNDSWGVHAVRPHCGNCQRYAFRIKRQLAERYIGVCPLSNFVVSEVPDDGHLVVRLEFVNFFLSPQHSSASACVTPDPVCDGLGSSVTFVRDRLAISVSKPPQRRVPGQAVLCCDVRILRCINLRHSDVHTFRFEQIGGSLIVRLQVGAVAAPWCVEEQHHILSLLEHVVIVLLADLNNRSTRDNRMLLLLC